MGICPVAQICFALPGQKRLPDFKLWGVERGLKWGLNPPRLILDDALDAPGFETSAQSLAGLHFGGVAHDFSGVGVGGDGVAPTQNVLRRQKLQTFVSRLERRTAIFEMLASQFTQAAGEITGRLAELPDSRRRPGADEALASISGGYGGIAK